MYYFFKEITVICGLIIDRGLMILV